MSDPALDSWWLQACINADEAIVKEAYYLDIWAKVRPNKPWDQLTKRTALAAFQKFWEELPDDPRIHRPPFNQICMIAEEYCTDEPEALDRTIQIALAGYEPDPDFPGTYRRKKA